MSSLKIWARPQLNLEQVDVADLELMLIWGSVCEAHPRTEPFIRSLKFAVKLLRFRCAQGAGLKLFVKKILVAVRIAICNFIWEFRAFFGAPADRACEGSDGLDPTP